MICPTCKNEMKSRRVESSYCGVLNRPLYEDVKYCPYCEWKGTTGAGKQLRNLIKEM